MRIETIISLVLSAISLIISVGSVFANHRLSLKRALLPILVVNKNSDKAEKVYDFPMFGFDSSNGKYIYHIENQTICLNNRNDAYFAFLIINEKPCSFGEVRIGASEGIVLPPIYFHSDYTPNKLEISVIIKSCSNDYYKYNIESSFSPYKRKLEYGISFQSADYKHAMSKLKIHRMKKMLRDNINFNDGDDSALDW